MVLYYTRGSGNFGGNGFYQKEGVVDKEGNLRVSFGFGSMEVRGEFGRRSLCRRTDSLKGQINVLGLLILVITAVTHGEPTPCGTGA